MDTDTIPMPVELVEQLEAPRAPAEKILQFNDASFDRVVRTVARVTGVTEDDIKGHRRKAPIAAARQVAYWLMRHRTEQFKGTQPGWSDIGRKFQRDHGTVMHGVRQVNNQCQVDARFRAKVNQAIAEL